MAVFIASWESNPVERTVVSCVMVECCVCGGTAPPKGEGTLAQSTGGDPLARARRILSDGAGHDAQGFVRGVGGMAEQAEFRERHVARYQRI